MGNSSSSRHEEQHVEEVVEFNSDPDLIEFNLNYDRYDNKKIDSFQLRITGNKMKEILLWNMKRTSKSAGRTPRQTGNKMKEILSSNMNRTSKSTGAAPRQTEFLHKIYKAFYEDGKSFIAIKELTGSKFFYFLKNVIEERGYDGEIIINDNWGLRSPYIDYFR